MRRPLTKRKCKHCQTFFAPDPRCARRQRYCSKPACRPASPKFRQALGTSICFGKRTKKLIGLLLPTR
jgi:hypothetical protein